MRELGDSSKMPGKNFSGVYPSLVIFLVLVVVLTVKLDSKPTVRAFRFFLVLFFKGLHSHGFSVLPKGFFRFFFSER